MSDEDLRLAAGQSGPDAHPPVPADEVAGMIEARRALGADAEAAIIAGFLERTGRAIDERIDQRIDRRVPAPAPERGSDQSAIWLALGSIGVGIPVTGAIGTMPGPVAAVVGCAAWGAIAVINVVYNRRNRGSAR